MTEYKNKNTPVEYTVFIHNIQTGKLEQCKPRATDTKTDMLGLAHLGLIQQTTIFCFCFNFFPVQKIGFAISCKLSPKMSKTDNLQSCLNLIFW